MMKIGQRKKRKEKRVIFTKTNPRFLSLFSMIFFVFFSFTIISCSSRIKDNSDRFKEGVFEIPAGEGYGKTTIIRKDSLQIEQYEKIATISNDSVNLEKKVSHIDTLYITWKNNFFYTLKMKSPKKELDKDPIFVQITKVTDKGYDFTAKVGFSKFKQDGTVYKIK